MSSVRSENTLQIAQSKKNKVHPILHIISPGKRTLLLTIQLQGASCSQTAQSDKRKKRGTPPSPYPVVTTSIDNSVNKIDEGKDDPQKGL
jgi:hypothetical protein